MEGPPWLRKEGFSDPGLDLKPAWAMETCPQHLLEKWE